MSSSEQSIDNDSSDDGFCTINIPVTNSEIKLHPYYIYPSLEDPGIDDIYNDKIYKNESLDVLNRYLELCKQNKSLPVKRIINQLSSVEMDLKYSILQPKDIKSLCKFLTENMTIETLNLSYNYLSKEACFYLARLLLENKTIKYLYMSGCKIGPSGMKELSKALEDNTTLKILSLESNFIGNEGLEILSTTMINSSIISYNLSNNNFNLNSGMILSNVFKNEVVIQHLDLSWNMIENGVIIFLKNLRENTSLLSLNLSWNGLRGQRTALAVKMLIKQNINLQHLDISNNRMDSEAFLTISGGFPFIKSISTLKIGSNPINYNDTVEILKKIVKKKTTLNMVDMENICVNKKFVRTLEKFRIKQPETNIQINFGYVIDNFVIIDVDIKEIVFKRAFYLTLKKKRNKIDFRKFILNLHYQFGKKIVNVRDVEHEFQRKKLQLDIPLMTGIFQAFAAKNKKCVDIDEMVHWALKLWPEPIKIEVSKPKMKKEEKVKKLKNKNKK